MDQVAIGRIRLRARIAFCRPADGTGEMHAQY